MATILGYARVSTAGQDLDGQLVALAAQGVEPSQTFTDKLSGAVNTDRPGLAALLHYAREGDTVVVTAIDRLTMASTRKNLLGSLFRQESWQ